LNGADGFNRTAIAAMIAIPVTVQDYPIASVLR
jgi:hypothetical protein